MRLSRVAALALIVGTTGSMFVSAALAASDCSKLVELADWGENSSGDISVVSGESCLFPITMRGHFAKAVARQVEKAQHNDLRIQSESQI